MRDTPNTNFAFFNASLHKGLRLVLKINFPTPLYLASHDDIPNIPAGTLPHTIKNVSSTSQRLNPDAGRSEIGSIRLEIVDKDGGVSTRFNTEEVAGNGLTGQQVELYRGGEGMDWSDFRLEQTQQITQSVAFDKGGYKIQCADIQRAMRSDIFDTAKTALAADFLQGASTLTVFDTSDFEACSHVASFGDQPTGSYFYLKIKYENGFEIVRATGKTATTFTGVSRGVFGTQDVDHIFPTGEDQDSSVEIEEYVYLELPAPAMAYALLTGGLPGGGTIPARWNLGISSSWVDLDSFENIGDDWFQSGDYSKGLIFRFQGVTKTDGKRFIEREVNLLAGAFMYVRADGKLYLKRMTGVLSTSDYVAELYPMTVVKHGPLKHNLAKVRNTFDIEWSWVHFPGEDKPRYVRRNILVDGNSQSIHGESKVHKLKFKGLHNERHTYTTLLNRFDALRDRFAGPPLTIDLDLMPFMNDLEVGDVVRVYLPNVKDFTSGGFLDRSMEVQRISIDQQKGRVRVSLFGSSLKAEPIADVGAGVNSELPDAWYNSAGTDFATAGLSIDGAGILQSSGSLSGGTTSRSIYYYLGDFTIPSGMTLTVTGNTELRVRGTFQCNGTLRVSSGMPAHTAGFIGHTYGGRVKFDGRNPPYYPDYRWAPYNIRGRYDALPVLEIENNAGVLEGIPADMRGSGGGRGGDVLWWNGGDVVWEQRAQGGNGGTGGGSVVTVSRGFGYGVAGETDSSGTNGSEGGVTAIGPVFAAGSGGGGAPGSVVHLLDGTGVTFPIIAGNVVADYGLSPFHSTASDGGEVGKANPNDPVQLGIACARAQYVPKSREPYPDYTNTGLNPQDGVDGYSTYTATVYIRSASAPSTPAVDDGSFNFDTLVLTPPTGWSTTPPAGSDPLYVSTGQFQIQGITGTDETVTWTTPALLVSDGAAGGDGNSVYFAQIFRRSSGAPATPTGGSYDFGTKTLTPPTNWFDTPPASDGNALYVSTAIAEVNGTTGVDSTLTWSTPAELVNDGADGAPGSPGADGLSVHVSTVFRRNATAPITPSGGQYDFGTQSLTPPSLWFEEPPASDGNPLWASTATWSVQGTTGIDSSTTWSSPAKVVEDGTDGQGIRTVNAYRLNNNAYVSVTGSFADPLNGQTGWSLDVPTLTNDGDTVYVITRTFTDDGQAPQDASWYAPVIYAQRTDGDPGSPGSPGTDGNSVYYAQQFRRNASAPATPSGGSYNFATQTLTPSTSWSATPPASDGNPLWVSSAVAEAPVGGTDSSLTWAAPAELVSDGVDGNPGGDGNSVYYIQVFQRAAAQPGTPTGGSYNFATQTLTPPSGWSATPPASDGNPLWVSTTIAEAAVGGTDSTLTWTSPQDLVSDGADGAPGNDGNSVYFASIYQRAAAQPSTPTADDGSYNFATQTLTPATGWSTTPPASDGNPLWVSNGLFEAPANGTDNTVTWTTPANLVSDGADGSPGSPGDDGTSVFYASVYQRSASNPGTPTADDGSYNFGTQTLTPPSGWSVNPPASDGNPLWVSNGLFEAVAGGTDNTVTWSAASELVSDGADGSPGSPGADGNSVHVSVIYRRSIGAPATPTGGSYNFTNNTLTEPTNWFEEPPDDDGRSLWTSIGTFSINGTTGTDSTVTWSTPLRASASIYGSQVLTTRDWTLTPTDPMGPWDMISGTNNLAIVNNEEGPFGEYPPIMQIRGDGVSNPGWYNQAQGYFAYDKDKSYVFYTWVKLRNNVDSGLYMGWHNTGAGSERVKSLAGVVQTNPYYVANVGDGVLTLEKWYLAVGIVWADGALSSGQGLAGIYDPDTGVKIYNGTEFQWNGQQSETTYMRMGFYDNAAPVVPVTDGIDFTRTIGWIMDGNEPSIDEALKTAPLKGLMVGAVKINYIDYTTANNGEMYLHGLDRDGNPADIDGSFYFNGAKQTLPAGAVYTNEATDQGYIIIETGAGTPFTGTGDSQKIAGARLSVNDGTVAWEYDNNAAWTSFTPTDTMAIIGFYSSGSDLLNQASLVAPMPLESQLVDAARITANSLRAITATIGNLETRASGGSPTTPRLILQDNASPIKIFDTDDTTELFGLTNTASGLRLSILGDFVANSLNTANAFSDAGITDLRGRLGLLEPSGGTGGSLTVSGTPIIYGGATNTWKYNNVDVLGGGGVDTWITSGGNDVTLYLKVRGWDSGMGVQPAGDSTWEVKWQYRVDTGGGFGAWTDVNATLNQARWLFTGDMTTSAGPGEPTEWFYYLSEERSYVWTSALANNDYEFRVASRETAGGYTSAGDDLYAATVNEPISGGGVIEAHTHAANDITDWNTVAAGIITAHTALTSGLAGTDELLVSDAGTIKRMDVSVMNAYFNSNLSFAATSHTHTASQITDFDTEVSNNSSVAANTAKVSNATHTGDATGSTALTLQPAAITGKTALASGLVSTDELLVSDAGVLKRMDISVLEAYMQAALGGDPGAEFFRHVTTGYNSADVTVASTAPGSPAQGDVWFDTSGGSYDADTLDGLDTSAGSSPPSGRQVVTSHTNGYCYFGWINTVSGSAGTTTPTRIYGSYDSFLRYYTPANFKSTMGLATINDTTPDGGGGYLYQWRSSTSPVLYIRQASTGQIAKFFKSATSGGTSPTTASEEFTIENDGSPRKGGLGVPYYGTSTYVGGKISVQATAPTSPTKGDIWFDTA